MTMGSRPLTRRVGRARGALLALATAVLVAALASACGVPIDSDARSIRTTTTAQTTTTTEVSGAGHDVTLFFIAEAEGEAKLTAHRVKAESSPTAESALQLLLSVSRPDDLMSAIPPNTELLGIEIEGDRASVDLSTEMDGLALDLERSAYAQIALTILELDGVSEVAFAIEGAPVDPPTEGGNKKFLRAGDLPVPDRPEDAGD